MMPPKVCLSFMLLKVVRMQSQWLILSIYSFDYVCMRFEVDILFSSGCILYNIVIALFQKCSKYFYDCHFLNISMYRLEVICISKNIRHCPFLLMKKYCFFHTFICSVCVCVYVCVYACLCV